MSNQDWQLCKPFFFFLIEMWDLAQKKIKKGIEGYLH